MSNETTGSWEKLRIFWIGVPHQRPAFVIDPEWAAKNERPVEADGDRVVAGDHDLANLHEVSSREDAEMLMKASDERAGGQARHQAVRIAVLVRQELVKQGVLEEEDEEQEDG